MKETEASGNGKSAELDALWKQAQDHAERGQWKQAKDCFTALLLRRPNDPQVLVQLSYIQSLAGHYREAREYAMAACAAGPREPPVVAEVLARLRTFNEAETLHRLIVALGSPKNVPIPLLLAGAAQLSYLNEQERALALLDEAKRADPNYPPTLLSRAQVLIYLARFEESERDLLHCMKRAPETPQLYSLLSRLRTQSPDSNHVAQLRRELNRPNRKPSDMALLGFALHKELDDLGEYDRAWQALEEALTAKRTLLKYRSEDSRELVNALIAMQPAPMASLSDAAIPAVLGESAGAGTDPATEPNGRIPIFIVGMHRSGTTLLEQMLDGHRDVRGVGELYDFTSQMRHATDYHCRGVIDATIVARAKGLDYAAVGHGYLDKMEWRLGAERYFTDKLPSNFLNIGFICRALPRAKILHMVRDPVETCFSNLRELFSEANPYSYDQLELADFYKQYRRLMAHWHRAWPGRIMDVDYAQLTREPETTMRRVAEFCGLDFEPRMLDLADRDRGVATASAVQVRQGIVARDRPKWAPYEAYLEPLIRALGEQL